MYITGGSRGLGLQLARVYAQRGAKVVLMARDARELGVAGEGGGAGPVVNDCDPTTCPPQGTDAGTDAFPSEGPYVGDAGHGFDAFPSETAQQIDSGQTFDAFPSETDPQLDGGQGFDAFPTEGPAQIDAAPPPEDATVDAFPEETAIFPDGGHP